jgi:hypothetical protein
MQTLSNFQIFVHEKLNRLDQENRDLRHILAEQHALRSPRATLTRDTFDISES